MKTIAINQPYFLPYLGYFQLINYVDCFVILDDVSYINRGWINRNNILLNDNSFLISIPVEKASQNKSIINTKFLIDDIFIRKNFKTIELSYNKAPFFKEIFELYKNIMLYRDLTVSSFILNSIKVILDYLGISKKIYLSHELNYNNKLTNADKLINIAKTLDYHFYVNAISGQKLYKKEYFLQQKINLLFLDSQFPYYKQFNNNFIDKLSILDILMFNSIQETNDMIKNNFLIK